MQNKKNNKIIIGVIVLVIAALGFVILQSKTGLFKGVIQIVSPRDVSLRDQPSTVTAIRRSGERNRYNLRIQDNDGLKRYTINTAANEDVLQGLAGASVGARNRRNYDDTCSGSLASTSSLIEGITITPKQFSLRATVGDCNGNSTTVSVPMPPLKALR